MRASLLFLPLVLAALAPAASAQVDPGIVCLTNAVPNPVGESRTFCEPMDSLGFIQFEQFIAGIEQLAEEYPDYVEAKVIGTSVLGLPIYFVEVTNEKSPVPREEKLQLGYSASIHANEAAGREGMTRVIEDLAAGRGPYGAELQPLLDRLILNVWFPNPDSWHSGDFFRSDYTGVLDGPAAFGYLRENANGFDLNRQLPNPGWILPSHEPMSQPETRAVVEELRYSGNHSNLAAGADLHGMINSPNMVRSIIPNQDYNFRRMVLIVEQLRATEERVESDPAYFEWQTADEIADTLDGVPLPVEPCAPAPVVGTTCVEGASDAHDKPFLWGARWDQIGYTDTGFTSDYLTLSPRSPTGGMGAVGTIVEFAYSHMVPDNKYVAKLTDMHVAGVRQIVRTQMEMALRLDSPMLAGTGAIAYLDDGAFVSSDGDPNAYEGGGPFDLRDDERRFDFDQVPYKVSNLDFWRDLAPFSVDPVEPVAPGTLTASSLAGYASLVLTDRTVESLTEPEAAAVRSWTESGGHLVLTDSALRFLDTAGITSGAVHSTCVYIGHSDLEARDHPLLADVDWNARVTAEASATGFGATEGSAQNYPEWGVDRTAFESVGGEVVGTTQGGTEPSPSCSGDSTDPLVSMGRLPLGSGSVDLIGAALPMPTQAYDHRYGLAPYSVSALTYWFFMNSFGGHVEWAPIEVPFVPDYPYDPLYGDAADAGEGSAEDEGAPAPTFGLAALAVVAAAFLASRRRR